MNTTKRLISLLLVLVLALGCAVGASAESEKENYEFTMMGNWGENGYVGELWLDQICDKLNLTINFDLPAASSYEDALQLMIASGEYPDVAILPDAWMSQTIFQEACEAGIFIDLADKLPNYENLMAHTASFSWEALDIFNDGRVWGVPRSTMVRADGYCLRETWLENLGIEYNEGDYLTADEFFDILYAFTHNDPDGNKIDDTYGLMGYADAEGNLITFLGQIFGIGDRDAWCDYDGEVIALKYSKDLPNFKNYLAFANRCWEAGVIDPDGFSIDLSTGNQRWDNGMYGCRQMFPGNMRIRVPDDPSKADTRCKFLPGVVEKEGDKYGYANFATGIWYFWSITSKAEKPERILEFFDYILSDEQWTNLSARGLEGVTFTKNADGSFDTSIQDKLTDEQKNNAPMQVILRRSDGAEFFVPITYTPEERERITKLIDVTLENYIPALDRGYVPAIATDPTFIEYNAYMNEQINKIIVGEVEVDEWDNILEGWYAAGGEEYVNDMRAYIASVNK